LLHLIIIKYHPKNKQWSLHSNLPFPRLNIKRPDSWTWRFYPGPRNLSPFHANLNSSDLGIRLYGVVCKNNSYVNSTQSFMSYGCPWTTSRVIPRWFAKIIHMSILHGSFQLYGCPWTIPRIISIRIKSFDWNFVWNPIDMYNFILVVSLNAWEE